MGSNPCLARSERFELPTLGIEIRCSIQLSYERSGDMIPKGVKRLSKIMPKIK